MPPNQIVQITGHKNLQSINNYSSLKERQMEKTFQKFCHPHYQQRMAYCQQYNRVYKVILLRHIHQLQPLKTHSKQCFKEIISLDSGGVLNINLASTKNTVTSPDLGPKTKEKNDM